MQEEIVRRVTEAYERGEPIAYSRGPLADRRAKSVLGLPGHQSAVCSAIRKAVEERLIVKVVTDRTSKVYFSDRVKDYPVVELHPVLP